MSRHGGVRLLIEGITNSGADVATFGIIFPRCDDFPQIVGTSIVNSTENVKAMVGDYINGSVPDEPLYRGVEDPDNMRFELCPEWDTPDLRQIIDETTQAIDDG